MARLSRRLRVCKWVGTVGCVLIAGAFLACVVGCRIAYVWETEGQLCSLALSGGCINFIQNYGKDWAEASGWNLEYCPPISSSVSDFRWLPGIRQHFYLEGGKHTTSMYLPLWIPFLLLLMPTPLLWWRDRRKRIPGFCRRCDYDLTGNTSGVCPECGLEVTAAAEQGMP